MNGHRMSRIGRNGLLLLSLIVVCCLCFRAIGQASLSSSGPRKDSSAGPSSSDFTTSLDFDFFKTKVQPVLLKTRPGHAPCYSCHVLESRAFRLQLLNPGSTTWTDEQSKKNFKSAFDQVEPGDALRSRLLRHPLAPEAGGDAFHSGGRQFISQNDPDWLVIADWVRGAGRAITAASPPLSLVRIYVTDSASDSIDVIDPATNQVVQVIHGIVLPHGIAFSPDGSRIYVSNESESVLDIIDRSSGGILNKVPLSARPNNIAITKDGGRVLVGIRSQPGFVDVIDTVTQKRTNSIPVDGSVHNVYVTPDGKFAVTGSIENKAASVIDLATDKMAWEVKFDRPVRPMAFETAANGSTSRMFVQLSNLNGFAVVDFARRAEVARIKFPDRPGGFGAVEGRMGTPSHGIGVTPDGKSLWVNSTVANAVFKYSLPDLKLVGYSKLPEVRSPGRAATSSVPEWITFTPDSKFVYVSNSGARMISVIDTSTLKEVATVPVGEVPKRLNTLVIR